MNTNVILCMDDYSSVSPKLNAIELFWSWMKGYVQSRHPRSQQDLEDLLEEAWQKIPINVIQAYIRRIRTIVQQIILADGWNTDG